MLNKEKPVEILIDESKCTKCGICLEICPMYLKRDENNFPTARLNEDKENLFGCIQCGNCMMLCPTDAIEVKGEDIDKEHLRELNPNLPDYNAVNSLFINRRSCRKFKEKEISKEDIDKIIKSAATAAVSVPPSEVKVLVINGRNKVKEFSDDLFKSMEKFIKMMNPFTVGLIGLFGGKAQYKTFKDFIIPLTKYTIEQKQNGVDYLTYDAPCVMIFYGSENTDKEDWMIASTHATIVAEALGLGTCIIGSIPPAIQANPHLRKKYGFSKTDKLGCAIVMGYPEIKFRKGFQRNFKEVRFI